MERVSRVRARILLLLFLLVLGFYALKLYDEQIIKTGGSMDNTTTFVTLTRVKAARGDILDKNGNVMVSNRASYDLALNHYVLLSANGTNDYLYDLVQRCKEVGITYTEHFPVSQERPFTYKLDELNSAWKSYFQQFLSYKGGLDSDITAPLLVEKLREKYKIPAEWTEEEARQVIGLRYEMDLRNCVPTMAKYVFVADATDEQLSAIVELNVPGMDVEASTVREYSTTYAAHILGYVGAMNAEQWEYYQNIPGYEMDTEVGQDGLEAAYEEYLHGVDGWREDTVAADGTLISSRYLSEPQAGSNVEISIDMNLQMAAEDTMAQVIYNLVYGEDDHKDGRDAEGGAVVAMDVRTGQVLACASYPTYDLTSFFDDYTELEQDPLKPLYNRALLAAYPPGSTYKMSMVVTAFQAKMIDSETTIQTKGMFTKYIEDKFNPTCLHWDGRGGCHGAITAAEALMVSCNYFFYDLGDRLPISQIDSVAKSLGLGEHSGIELYEVVGHRSNEQTKAMLHEGMDSGYYSADKIMTAIGQSDNRFTPIQLCVYASTLANQGTRYKATFMNRVVSADYQTLIEETSPVILDKLDISDECYMSYVDGMVKVTSDPSGTAFLTFRGYPIAVAGKTGTAETQIPSASDNGSFVCFAPADDPQIAISVYIEKGGHGSTLATIAKAVLDEYFNVGEISEVTIYENKLS